MLAPVDVLDTAGTNLTDRIRTLMSGDPESEESHGAVMAAYEEGLRRFLPIDGEGRLINEIVGYVENNPGVASRSNLRTI